MKTKNRIYFFANFGDWNKVPYGGGEVGNRRTLALLKKGDFEIITIPKYLRVSNHSFLNLIKLGIRILRNITYYTKTLLKGRRSHSIVHIAGFYGPMIYFEYILISIAKLLNYKIIYEMRGGGADVYYKSGSVLYKYFFSESIKKSHKIFSQGIENYELLKKIKPNISVFYYPNYVIEGFYPQNYPSKNYEQIRFIYFGRISKSKNTDLVIDIFLELCKKYNNILLDIVGNYDDNIYYNQLIDKIKQSKYQDKIKLWPACNHEQLKKHLENKHFYIFPSKEPHEGHSNALTEAMAWGVIPIATTQGFNSSVINNNKLIIDDLQADSFIRRISNIIDSNNTENISIEVYNRVKENYTDKIIEKQLINEYNTLFLDYFR